MIGVRTRKGLNRLMALACAVFVAISVLVIAPESSAAPGGRGSVKHSSKGKRGGGASRSTGRGATRKGSPGRGATRKGSPGRSGARRGRHGGNHRRYSARKDARRSWRRWRAITGIIRIGAYYATRPRYTTTVVVTGTTYYYGGGVYYVSSGSGYVVASAPPGAVVYAVPTATTVVYVGTTPYYYYGGTYYVATTQPAEPPPPKESDAAEEEVPEPEMTEDEHNYKVIAPPTGATVPYLPEEADETSIGGKTYFVYDETYYQPFVSDGETIYMVIDDPRS